MRGDAKQRLPEDEDPDEDDGWVMSRERIEVSSESSESSELKGESAIFRDLNVTGDGARESSGVGGSSCIGGGVRDGGILRRRAREVCRWIDELEAEFLSTGDNVADRDEVS